MACAFWACPWAPPSKARFCHQVAKALAADLATLRRVPSLQARHVIMTKSLMHRVTNLLRAIRGNLLAFKDAAELYDSMEDFERPYLGRVALPEPKTSLKCSIAALLRIFYTWSETQIFETDLEMGAGSGIPGKRAISSLRVCSTVRNILPPQDGLILRPSHAVPDGRRAASEMSDNVQLFPWETSISKNLEKSSTFIDL